MIEKHFSIELGRSKWLLSYLIIIHSLMLGTMMTLLADMWLSLIAVATISISFIYYCKQYQWLKKGRAITKIERNAKQQWTLFYSDNSSQGHLALNHCVATSKLVILYFSGASSRRIKSVTILEDAVDADLFRALRVYCRDPKTFLQ